MPGGVIKPIPGNIERAIRRMAPNADWDSLKFIAENYQLERDHLGKRESPRQTRASLDNIIEKAAWLRADLAMLNEESRDAIGDWALIEQTAWQLTLLISASKKGHSETQPREGRPASIRKAFVRSIAGLLQRAGYEIDGTPNGVLVPIASELLALYDDKPADVPALVRSALRENPPEIV